MIVAVDWVLAGRTGRRSDECGGRRRRTGLTTTENGAGDDDDDGKRRADGVSGGVSCSRWNECDIGGQGLLERMFLLFRISNMRLIT